MRYNFSNVSPVGDRVLSLPFLAIFVSTLNSLRVLQILTTAVRCGESSLLENAMQFVEEETEEVAWSHGLKKVFTSLTITRRYFHVRIL